MNTRMIEKKGQKAILQLRQNKFANGFPFMINVHELPSDQCYMEYPDGKVKLVTLSVSRMNFEVIKVLHFSKADKLRKRLGIK